MTPEKQDRLIQALTRIAEHEHRADRRYRNMVDVSELDDLQRIASNALAQDTGTEDGDGPVPETPLEDLQRQLAQQNTNLMWLIDVINEAHGALCPEQTGTWQQKAIQVLEAARSHAQRPARQDAPLGEWEMTIDLGPGDFDQQQENALFERFSSEPACSDPLLFSREGRKCIEISIQHTNAASALTAVLAMLHDLQPGVNIMNLLEIHAFAEPEPIAWQVGVPRELWGLKQDQALKEGWMLFGGDLPIDPMHIGRVELPADKSRFQTNDEAFGYVLARALQGSRLHLLAIYLHGRVTDQDVPVPACLLEN